MHDQQDIKQALQQWAQTYGGTQFERLGYVGQDRLQAASTVQGDAPADRVERIVQRLAARGYWKEAQVLRADCFLASLPESERLQRLSRIGLRIGRGSYYIYLKGALLFLEGAFCGPSVLSR